MKEEREGFFSFQWHMRFFSSPFPFPLSLSPSPSLTSTRLRDVVTDDGLGVHFGSLDNLLPRAHLCGDGGRARMERGKLEKGREQAKVKQTEEKGGGRA